jgi:hypothetical protein
MTLNDLDYLFCKQLSSFQIRLNPMIGYNLIKTAMDAGFDPNASGFEAWFLHKCAVVLKNYKPEV